MGKYLKPLGSNTFKW